MDWLIHHIVDPLVNDIRGAILKLVGWANSLWGVLVGFFSHIGGIFQWWHRTLVGWVQTARRYLIALGQFLSWLLYIQIPRVAENVFNRAYVMAHQLFDFVRNEARILIDNVVNFVRSEIGKLFNALTDLRNWIFDRVHEIVNTLNWLLGKVRQFLTEPSILADWLAGAMWNALFNYAVAHAPAIGAWARRRAITATYWSASLLESIIEKVL